MKIANSCKVKCQSFLFLVLQPPPPPNPPTATSQPIPSWPTALLIHHLVTRKLKFGIFSDKGERVVQETALNLNYKREEL